MLAFDLIFIVIFIQLCINIVPKYQIGEITSSLGDFELFQYF